MVNKVLGHAPCGCGGKKKVMQAKRKGAHLYSRCDSCGLDQRNGARVQQKLWDETEWVDRPPTPPENVNISVKPEKQQAARPSDDAGLEDFEPTGEEAEFQPKEPSQPKNKAKGGFLKFAGVTLLLTALGGIAWKA